MIRSAPTLLATSLPAAACRHRLKPVRLPVAHPSAGVEGRDARTGEPDADSVSVILRS